MTDIAAGRPAQSNIGLRLERQQRQHMIDIGQHGARPARPPRPDRGRNIIDDRDARIARTHPARHAMGEIGAVDDDEDVRPGLDDIGRGFADQPQDLRQLLHHRRQADDRQFLDRKARGQPLARHRPAADAFEPYRATEALAQHLHQIGAEPVAGLFGRDQEDCSLWRGARRHHAPMPCTNRPALSAASIMACGSTTIA
jgi:hypothetical protein